MVKLLDVFSHFSYLNYHRLGLYFESVNSMYLLMHFMSLFVFKKLENFCEEKYTLWYLIRKYLLVLMKYI